MEQSCRDVAFAFTYPPCTSNCPTLTCLVE
jgi:hypothetical protein